MIRSDATTSLQQREETGLPIFPRQYHALESPLGWSSDYRELKCASRRGKPQRLLTLITTLMTHPSCIICTAVRVFFKLSAMNK